MDMDGTTKSYWRHEIVPLQAHMSSNIVADIVFVTGNPMERAMRWAGILNSLGQGPKPAEGSVHYFIGPETSHHLRYQVSVNAKELKAAGLGDLKRRPFN